MIVSPRVRAEARRHFNCSSLEGAELEGKREADDKEGQKARGAHAFALAAATMLSEYKKAPYDDVVWADAQCQTHQLSRTNLFRSRRHRNGARALGKAAI